MTNLLKKENLNENEKVERRLFLSKINFALNMLTEIEFKDYKLLSLNLKEDLIIFSNGQNEEKLSIKNIINELPSENLETTEIVEKYKNKSLMNDDIKFSETSEMTNPKDILESIKLSETSEMTENKNFNDMKGGTKNIFQKSKYSETSSLAQTDMSNYSETSSAVFNGRSDKYSDTSVLNITESQEIFKKAQIGGKLNYTTDTLDNLSELKQRKLSKITGKLDMGIFTKKTQTGGAIDSLKKKMMNVGINSNSSTSSICE